MYADKVTPSMERAIDETNRRRAKQIAYNEANGIDPQPLRKKIADILDSLQREDADTDKLLGGGGRQQSRGKAPVPGFAGRATGQVGQHAKAIAGEMPRAQMESLVESLTEQMHQAAADLQFEVAARLRDEIKELKRELRDMREAGVK